MKSHSRLGIHQTYVSAIPSYCKYYRLITVSVPTMFQSRREDMNAIGSSPAWRTVINAATRVAPTEATVLLQGESGTGKEVIARLIHQRSPRTHGPFVAINCAALPEQLLESERFGDERGAFTGAQQSKAGQIELAARGVLFLDEMSEMSLAAQVKFLRFLQEREYQRLGGTRLQKADVRTIAASNRDLGEAIDCGTFREDLFYRLQVFDILLPPLRDRVGDIPLLAEQFLADFSITLAVAIDSCQILARGRLDTGRLGELRQKFLIRRAGSRRTMLRSAAFASSVVASMPIVLPLSKPASARRRRIQVKTASCVSRSMRRRVREIVE